MNHLAPRAHRMVLFICTGNYYRSRFAEALFNHLATQRRLPWRAESRGLATYLLGDDDLLADVVLRAMRERKIPPAMASPSCRQINEADLTAADVLIAINKSEHAPLIDRYYHAWADKVTYWDISDMDDSSPLEAIPKIERCVHELLGQLESLPSPAPTADALPPPPA